MVSLLKYGAIVNYFLYQQGARFRYKVLMLTFLECWMYNTEVENLTTL